MISAVLHASLVKYSMGEIFTPLGRWFADKPQGLLHCEHTWPGKKGGSKVVANCKFLSDPECGLKMVIREDLL